MIATPTSLQIKYTDIRIKFFAEELAKSTYDLPKQPLDHQDAIRF